MTKPPAGALSKVPEVTLGFWVIKVLATTLGETGGDAVTMSMNLGYAIGSFIFIGIFAATVVAQIYAEAFDPFLYWVTIVATTTLGTTMADFADRSLGIGYSGGSLILFAGLIASLAVWRLSEGSISVNTVATPRVRNILLGGDPVVADARHGAGRLDGRYEWPWLRGRSGRLRRRSGGCRRRIFLHQNLPHLAILGGVHSDATAWRNSRGPAGQTARKRRARDQPLCRLRHSCCDHCRSDPHPPATGGGASRRRRAERVKQPIVLFL